MAAHRTLGFSLLVSSLLALAGYHAQPVAPVAAQDMSMNMRGMNMPEAPQVPPVLGYAEREEILFIHTEVSDPEIGDILTNMMDSPVLLVESLARTPQEMLARVYVFTNGVQPDGPRGPLDHQPDVFDHPPETAGYTPLRNVVLVTWSDDARPRPLRSAAEITDAEVAGEITLEVTDVVVNMPFLTWPGGRR